MMKGRKTQHGRSGRDGSSFIRLACEAFVVLIPASTFTVTRIYRTSRRTKFALKECMDYKSGPVNEEWGREIAAL